jgi:FAD/FMN-containing dehydrogenase
VHVNLLPADQQEAARAQELVIEMARYAVNLGGTVSAEHGLGKRKAGLLELMYDAAELAAMRKIKYRLDPQWLLGRGTLFRNFG